MPAANWEEIHAELLRRIRAREWSPGMLIPGELELAREFGCARATVGRALTRLSDDGLVDRRRRAGSRVAEMPVRRATLSIPVIRHEVTSAGAIYRHQLLGRRQGPASVPDAARLGVDPGEEILFLSALHLADDHPHAFEARWVNLKAAPGLANADLSETSANEWLVQNAWYSDGTLAFQADAAGEAEADALDLAPGAPVFVLDRRTRAGDMPVTAVRLFYPPGYRLVTTL